MPTQTIQERITLPYRVTHGGSEGAGKGITFQDAVTMLRRRSVLVIVLCILILGLCGGGFVAWWLYWPGYRSECLIACVSNIPDPGLTLEHERLRQEEHERFVATQALVLKSPAILGETLKNNAVRDTNWYRKVSERGREHLIELTEELVAAPVRGTNLLRVALECRDPKDPVVIVDAVVRLWLETVKRESADEFAADLSSAQAEMEAIDRRLEEKRGQLQAIGLRLPPGARQDPVNNPTAVEVRQLTEQIAVLRLELSQLEQLRAIYNDPQSVAATAEDRTLVENDLQVAELRRGLFLLEQQRAADGMRYGTGHSILRQLDSQIEATRDKLAQLETEKLFEVQSANREAANAAYENQLHAIMLAQERLERAAAALQDQERLLDEYTTLEADIEREIEYRVERQKYMQGLERVVRQRSAVDISIAQPPTIPLERSSPSLFLLPIGLFLSLAIPTGLALGLEVLDKSLRTSQDVSRYLDVPVLGAIPHTDDEEIAITQVETATLDAPRSMVSEAFRRIRTNLQFSAPALRQRLLMVTSPRPEDGTTTVAVNLAIAGAQAGRRVLLVDANLRRPALNRFFAEDRTQGLTNLLVGESTLEGLVAPSGVKNLDVLVGGASAPNPAELLGSENCRVFFQEAVSRYEQVVRDAAPILVAADAAVLGAAVDGVILVLRAKVSTQGIAKRACGLLSDVGAHLFGVVLNAAQVTRGGYFREQLRTYYEYQEEPPAKSR